MISHITLRIILGYYTNLSPDEIIFEINEFGKPFIQNNIKSKIYFNLSHSHEKTLIGIYKKEIGVDIEYISNDINIEELADLILTKSEIEFLKKIDIKNKQKIFYDIWTRKESFFKARGT